MTLYHEELQPEKAESCYAPNISPTSQLTPFIRPTTKADTPSTMDPSPRDYEGNEQSDGTYADKGDIFLDKLSEI